MTYTIRAIASNFNLSFPLWSCFRAVVTSAAFSIIFAATYNFDKKTCDALQESIHDRYDETIVEFMVI